MQPIISENREKIVELCRQPPEQHDAHNFFSPQRKLADLLATEVDLVIEG